MGGDEIDGHPLASKSAAAANAVDIVLTLHGEVVVQYQGHLGGGMRVSVLVRDYGYDARKID